MTASAKPATPRFKILTGSPPPRRESGAGSKKNAEIIQALEGLPIGGALEHLGDEKGWGHVYLRWSRKNNCRLDYYVSIDGRKIVVKLGGEPKPHRKDARPMPTPPDALAGMGKPMPPAGLPRGLSPDEVNPNAKPHQGKKARATPLV